MMLHEDKYPSYGLCLGTMEKTAEKTAGIATVSARWTQ